MGVIALLLYSSFFQCIPHKWISAFHIYNFEVISCVPSQKDVKWLPVLLPSVVYSKTVIHLSVGETVWILLLTILRLITLLQPY